jgi:hypothetical protein
MYQPEAKFIRIEQQKKGLQYVQMPRTRPEILEAAGHLSSEVPRMWPGNRVFQG